MKHDKRESALTLSIETFGDFIHDHEFISFLSSKLDYYPGRSKYLINNTKKDFVPCNSLSNVVLNEAYSFWIKNSIPSTDKRSDRDAIYVSEMKYLQEYKQTLEFEDENISEFANVKRNGNSKTYMRTQHLIYMEKNRKLHTKLLLSRENVHCSFSTFFKYKPFYITPLPEQEKETCLCIKCQNPNLLLRMIKTYCGLKNLMKHSSATQFIKNDPEKDAKIFPRM